MDDLISRQAAIDMVEKESQVDGAYGYMDTKSIVDLLNDLPSAQKNSDIDEAVKYIKSVQEYLKDIGETWYVDYLSDAIDLLVSERRNG